MRFRRLFETHGEASPISLIVGSALFLISSLAITGLVTLSLASASRAQANTELTQAMESKVADWTGQPYSGYKIVGTPANPKSETLVYGAHKTTVKSVVEKDASGTFMLTISAPRQAPLSASTANCAAALAKPQAGCLSLTATESPSPLDVTPANPTGFTPKTTPAGRGLVIATLNINQLTTAKALDLRVALKVKAGVPVPTWRLALTCDDLRALAVTPDSKFSPVASGWTSARVTLTDAGRIGACPSPALRLWSDSTVQPVPADFTEIRAWRVAS